MYSLRYSSLLAGELTSGLEQLGAVVVGSTFRSQAMATTSGFRRSVHIWRRLQLTYSRKLYFLSALVRLRRALAAGDLLRVSP